MITITDAIIIAIITINPECTHRRPESMGSEQ